MPLSYDMLKVMKILTSSSCTVPEFFCIHSGGVLRVYPIGNVTAFGSKDVIVHLLASFISFVVTVLLIIRVMSFAPTVMVASRCSHFHGYLPLWNLTGLSCMLVESGYIKSPGTLSKRENSLFVVVKSEDM